jgi:hypothetical protein
VAPGAQARETQTDDPLRGSVSVPGLGEAAVDSVANEAGDDARRVATLALAHHPAAASVRDAPAAAAAAARAQRRVGVERANANANANADLAADPDADPDADPGALKSSAPLLGAFPRTVARVRSGGGGGGGGGGAGAAYTDTGSRAQSAADTGLSIDEPLLAAPGHTIHVYTHTRTHTHTYTTHTRSPSRADPLTRAPQRW